MSNRLRIQVPVQPWLETWLRERATLRGESLSSTTRVELETWHRVLISEIRRTVWTLEELELLVAAMRDQGAGVVSGELLVKAHTQLQQTPGWETHAIDQLLGKLERLSPAGDYAIQSALEQHAARGHDHTVRGWRLVGVVVVDPEGVRIHAAG